MGYNISIDEIQELSRRIALRKSLLEITNRLYAAGDLHEISLELKKYILPLLNARSVSVYAHDASRGDLYTLTGEEHQVREVRVPISGDSVAGFVAQSGKPLNMAYAPGKESAPGIQQMSSRRERPSMDPLSRTVQVLAVPVFYENTLAGVIEVSNRKDEARFSDDEQVFLEEIAEVLGIALYNRSRAVKKKKGPYDYLIRQNLVPESDLENLLADARRNNEPVENLLMSRCKIAREEIGRALEEFYGCEYVPFRESYPVPEELLKSLRRDYLLREMWVPLGRSNGSILVLVDDPNNIIKRDGIQSILKKKPIEFRVGLQEDIRQFINHFFAKREGNVVSITDLLGRVEPEEEAEEESDVSESDGVIMQLVNKVIHEAYVRRASDIHIEPNAKKKNVEVRFRVDGDCTVYQTLPYEYRAAIVSRIKIMSNLDITERRLPQDGKIRFRRGKGEEIELRVATMPTQGSHEDVVLRILTKGKIMRLEDMALSPYNYDNLTDILEKPYGLILAVGPTGSGKTTTLHAAIHHINRQSIKIWTIEDPIEITQEGIRQVQVNPKIGLDFARAMRSFLRSDPDVIMVGEMRDFETAKIGIEASLTGHLVLSTLHTNSAPETVVRLLDMGLDPLNFADSLLGILAQRLAKCLCSDCRELYHPTREEYDAIATHYGEEAFAKWGVPYSKNFTLYRPKGCPECGMTGYRGRIAVHELLINSDGIKSLIQRQATVDELREAAIEDGMSLLFQDGIHKVLDGLTDFDQVRRVCISASRSIKKSAHRKAALSKEQKNSRKKDG
ncbi:MAG TPA: GspE/PulE family protein [Syntrophales bacterium]|jgi:type II secretory ATPase GspE/PulE/Tfp pilus assembly ATPase PilB-like protein|nr:GspE/PulE family protein [Syntrophales bacterium]HRT62156.1 GspE/PulE family protein [Syntrophales bacterium]